MPSNPAEQAAEQAKRTAQRMREAADQAAKRSQQVANDAARRVREDAQRRVVESQTPWARRQSSPGLGSKLIGALIFGLIVLIVLLSIMSGHK